QNRWIRARDRRSVELSRGKGIPTMRKDVKLGFTIGGVLLAVLIVYVLVISSGPPQHRNDVSLVKPELSPADNGGGGGASGNKTGDAAAPVPKSSASDRDVD